MRYSFGMTKIASLFLLLFVVGCAAPRTGSPAPKVAWDFQVKRVGEFPRGKVYLKVNGESHLVVSEATTNYQQLKPDEYKDYGIPARALLASYSWYAGYGDLLWVMQKGRTVEVFRQEMDEGEHSRYPVKRVKVIPF